MRTLRGMSDAAELCSCDRITRSALNRLQRQDNFLDLLSYTELACPAFAAVLSDVATATIPQSVSSDGGDEDGDRFGRGPGGSNDPSEDDDGDSSDDGGDRGDGGDGDGGDGDGGDGDARTGS